MKFHSSVQSSNDGSSCENNNNKPTLFVPLGLLSDGCDTGSASKANRNLVKLTTLHFVNPQIKEEHVFPIGLGDHNGNHNYVRKKITHDLKELTTELQEYYICWIVINWDSLIYDYFMSEIFIHIKMSND